MLTTLSRSWIAEMLIASYSNLTTSSLQFVSPWRQRMTTNLLSLTLHFQENRTAASPPAYTGSLRTLISTLCVWFPPPAISKMRHCQVPLQVHPTSHPTSLPNPLITLRRRSTCLLFLSLTVTLFLSCRKSPRPGNRVAVLSPRSNNFATPYSNKTYRLFSSRRLH